MWQGDVLRAFSYGAGLVFLTALGGQCASFWQGRRPLRRLALLIGCIVLGTLAGWKVATWFNNRVFWQILLAAGLMMPRRFGVGPVLLFLAAMVGVVDFGQPFAVLLGSVAGLFVSAGIEQKARSVVRPEIADVFQAVAVTAVLLIALMGVLGI
jgi:hypothetical protein